MRNSTAIAQSKRGFELATDQLIVNFSRELTDFETRAREGTAPIKVVRQPREEWWLGRARPLLCTCWHWPRWECGAGAVSRRGA